MFHERSAGRRERWCGGQGKRGEVQKDEKEIPYMTTSIKSDESVKMGIITDIKQELRKANSLKINYSTRKGTY